MGFSERTASLVIFVNLFVKSYRVCTEGEIYRHTHRSNMFQNLLSWLPRQYFKQHFHIKLFQKLGYKNMLPYKMTCPNSREIIHVSFVDKAIPECTPRWPAKSREILLIDSPTDRQTDRYMDR